MAPLLYQCLDKLGLEATLLGQMCVLLVAGVLGRVVLTSGQGTGAPGGQQGGGEGWTEASRTVKLFFLVGDFFPVWGLYILYSTSDVLLAEAGR